MAHQVPDLTQGRDPPKDVDLNQVLAGSNWPQTFNQEDAMKRIVELDNQCGKSRVDALWQDWLAVKENPPFNRYEIPADRSVRVFVNWMLNQLSTGHASEAKTLSDAVLVSKFIEFMKSHHGGITNAQEKTLEVIIETLNAFLDQYVEHLVMFEVH